MELLLQLTQTYFFTFRTWNIAMHHQLQMMEQTAAKFIHITFRFCTHICS